MSLLKPFYPPGSFLAPRVMEELRPMSALAETEGESPSSALASVAGDMPMLCHPAALGPEALSAMADCGLTPPSEVDYYQSRAEYLALLSARVAAGGRAVATFPMPPGLMPDDGWVVPPAALAMLNDKVSLSDLVPPQNLPRRRVVAGADQVSAALAELRPPVVVKAGGRPGAAGGAGVMVVRSRRHVARARERLAGLDQLIVEQLVVARRNICVQVAVLPDGTLRRLGGSNQICAASGLYLGNRITGAPLSEAALDLAQTIAAAGAQRGFRGIAGFDILEPESGPPLAIDLNFRPNGSTPLLLLHGSLGRARGLPCAQYVISSTKLTLSAALTRLRPGFEAGWLLLVGAYDPARIGQTERPRWVRLIVMAEDEAQLDRRIAALGRAGLDPVLPRRNVVSRVLAGLAPRKNGELA